MGFWFLEVIGKYHNPNAISFLFFWLDLLFPHLIYIFNLRKKISLDETTEFARKVTRRVERDRLVYYKQTADAGYWDEYWDKQICPEFYVGALEGQLYHFEGIFTKYLPANERILEAGCGPAQWVIALRQRDYNVEGVDWSKETIERVHGLFPDLPISYGDVRALPVKDWFYGAYISMGVIEHRVEGPEPFLTEAFRVLKPGGVAIFSVPWFNMLRIMKAWVGCYSGIDIRGMNFYQYAFRAGDIKDYLATAGFQVVDEKSYNLKMGFEDELPFLDSLYHKGLFGRILKRLVRRRHLTEKLCGHSRIYVCRKP
jgi:SAM-dependent methyltransferase